VSIQRDKGRQTDRQTDREKDQYSATDPVSWFDCTVGFRADLVKVVRYLL